MLRHARARLMYARGHNGGAPLLLALLLGTLAFGRPAHAQLIEGIEAWSDATIGLSSTRWAGPRVETPTPRARPSAPQRLDSLTYPISIHAGADVAPARVRAVLAAAEQAHVLLAATGFLTSFGDAGLGGTGARDVYVVQNAQAGAAAGLDAAGNLSALDGARAYALVDARLPADRVGPCTARALVEAQLLELDPAEAASLRIASAAALAGLITGEFGCDERIAITRPEQSPFRDPAHGAAFLRALDARAAAGTGTFLFHMWQFARQRTWEGRDLRASPDLIEAIAKARDLTHDDFALDAARISEELWRRSDVRMQAVAFAALPVFTRERGVEPLGSTFLRVTLPSPQPGKRLRVWASAEPGAGFALAASRLDARGEPLMRIEAKPQRDVRSQISVELDDATHAVLISATNVEDGTPDFDLELTPRLVTLTVDVAP